MKSTKIYMDDPLIRLELMHQKKLCVLAIVLSAVSIAISTIALLWK